METIETLLVAAFDQKSLSYVAIGRQNMSSTGEDAARRAGCTVMAQAPQAGHVRGLSSTEVIVQRVALGLRSAAPRGLVITKIPGTLWQPPRAAAAHSEPTAAAPQCNVPRARRRG